MYKHPTSPKSELAKLKKEKQVFGFCTEWADKRKLIIFLSKGKRYQQTNYSSGWG
jgi:hypothetical protein